MAGHSKWANIKHRKGREDAKRGKIFTKLIRELVVAAKQGGGDPNSNPRLRLAMDKARTANMTKDTVDRAIKRGAGNEEADNLEEIRYEGYGPGGVALLVECLSDNRNRTVSDVRHAFTKAGGSLGTDGSVSYLFKRQGIISFSPGSDENKIMEVAIEAGAEDVLTNDDKSIDISTAPEQLSVVAAALQAAGLTFQRAEISEVASVQISLNKDDAETFVKLVETLEDLDDVQNVHSNADLPDEFYDD